MSKNKQLAEHKEFKVEQQSFSGLLPPPDILRDYDKIYKGMAHEIVELAQEAQKHYIFMERQEVQLNLLNLIFSFILGLVGQIGSVIITIAGLVAAYFYIKTGAAKLAYYTAGSSVVICGYLIWWKVKEVSKNKNN